MQVTANGKPVELRDGATVGDLLEALGLRSRWVIAERNGEALPRAQMDLTVLAPGDRVELVRAVAGG
ncbi:MAG: sulfur carrier protein ThiS [Acidimicrobiales bacterium]